MSPGLKLLVKRAKVLGRARAAKGGWLAGGILQAKCFVFVTLSLPEEPPTTDPHLPAVPPVALPSYF